LEEIKVKMFKLEDNVEAGLNEIKELKEQIAQMEEEMEHKNDGIAQL